MRKKDCNTLQQHVFIIHFLPFLSRIPWQPMLPLCLPHCPSLSPAKYSVCFHPPTTVSCCQNGTTVIVQRRWIHTKPCLCLPSSVLDADLFSNPWATHWSHPFFVIICHGSHWWHPGPSPQSWSPPPHSLPPTIKYNPHTHFLSHIPDNDSGGAGHVQRVQLEVGQSAHIPTFYFTSSCPSLSCSYWYPWTISTVNHQHPPWWSSWLSTCLSTGADCLLPHLYCTLRPPSGPTIGHNWGDCLFSLPQPGVFSHWLLGVQVSQLLTVHPRTPPILLCSQLLFFCCHFSHLMWYCPDWLYALCDNLGHIITDCPFSEDPSQGVIFNDRDPDRLWSCPSGTSLQRG